MKVLKINVHFFFIFLIIFTISRSSQAQTLYWQIISEDVYVFDILYDGNQNIYFSGGSSSNYYVYRSTDLGNTWTQHGNGLGGNSINLAIDSSSVLWGGGRNSGKIYKSTNQGDDWIIVNPSSGIIPSLVVSPNNWIWAGTLNGKVVYSSDAGNTWLTDSLDNEGIWAIASNSLNHIFAGSMDGRIYRTTNLGTSWELAYDVPPLGIWGMVIDDSNHIYANRWNVRLISTDNGNTWTEIAGVQLDRLFLDKYHRFYAGPLGRRSIDNCITWSFIGPAGSLFVNAFTFIDSLIFAATTDGVYLYDPSYQPYIGNNYFPLTVGNKWQFNERCNNHFAGNSVYYVERDTLIESEKYYLIQGEINDWVRYDNEVNMFFLRWNDSDYVVMDYNLNEGSTFQHMLFNSHQIKTASIVAPTFISVFDSSYHSKGNFWTEGTPPAVGSHKTYYSENLGETRQEGHFSGPGGTNTICVRKMIRAIIKDSTGIRYFSDKIKPVITFQPVVVTNKFNLDWNFSVDHFYSRFNQYYNENFIDTVLLLSYYSNGDTTIFNDSIAAVNEPSSINYSVSFMLDSMLMKNDFNLFIKFMPLIKV